MEKRLRNYLAYLAEEVDLKEPAERLLTREELLTQIAFFQHERLIHLIVTVTFAVLTLISLIGCFVVETPAMMVLTGLFLVLLVPYIRHYYILENGVQALYGYYDSLIQKEE